MLLLGISAWLTDHPSPEQSCRFAEEKDAGRHAAAPQLFWLDYCETVATLLKPACEIVLYEFAFAVCETVEMLPLPAWVM